jgi:hypothetical protein
MGELTPEIMADEVLSIYKLHNLMPNDALSADTLLMSFNANKDFLQLGVDWLIRKGFVMINNKGSYILTAKGYIKPL